MKVACVQPASDLYREIKTVSLTNQNTSSGEYKQHLFFSILHIILYYMYIYITLYYIEASVNIQ